MNYKQIEKKILKNKAVQGVIKVRDKIDSLFGETKKIKIDMKGHTFKKINWSPMEKKFIKWTGR